MGAYTADQSAISEFFAADKHMKSSVISPSDIEYLGRIWDILVARMLQKGLMWLRAHLSPLSICVRSSGIKFPSIGNLILVRQQPDHVACRDCNPGEGEDLYYTDNDHRLPK